MDAGHSDTIAQPEVHLSENQSMNCPKSLEDAIEGLYVTFSKYPLPQETCPCPCCHSADADDLLHAAPLRELQWKHLAGYSTEALMVWGDLDCYKHFLPRILELVLTAGEWPKSPNPERVFHVLRYGEWRSWPRHEQEAVEWILQAVWETVRSNPPIESGYIDVDQWLCCISQCEESLVPYLSEWADDERVSAAWALSSLILGSTIAYTDENTNHEPPVWEGEESRVKHRRVVPAAAAPGRILEELRCAIRSASAMGKIAHRTGQTTPRRSRVPEP